jgi:hypothetical protein
LGFVFILPKCDINNARFVRLEISAVGKLALVLPELLAVNFYNKILTKRGARGSVAV